VIFLFVLYLAWFGLLLYSSLILQRLRIHSFKVNQPHHHFISFLVDIGEAGEYGEEGGDVLKSAGELVSIAGD